jgi:hypothetical protein
MREREQDEPERGAGSFFERQERVCRRPGEERASRLRLEARFGEAPSRAKPSKTEARKRERMTRKVDDRPEQLVLELVPAADQGPEEVEVGVAVPSELRCRVLERTRDERGRPVVQRMSDRGGRLDQVDFESERAEERGGDENRVNRGADIVLKAGERQLSGARPAADRLLRLDDAYRAPGLSQRDRGSKAVRPCSNNDRV